MSEDSGIDKSTVFQLKAFAETVRAGGYSEGAAAMGIADKYRIIRALERLDASSFQSERPDRREGPSRLLGGATAASRSPLHEV